MIKLYTWGTPNGKKVSIMLEEIEMPYEVYPVNFGKNEQFKPEYLAINPNNKIPSIIDTEGPGGKPFTLFESGAMRVIVHETFPLRDASAAHRVMESSAHIGKLVLLVQS